MFEKLFVKTSDLVFHTIAPYAVERERFLAHCDEEGFSKVALRRIAGIVVTAACDRTRMAGWTWIRSALKPPRAA